MAVYSILFFISPLVLLSSFKGAAKPEIRLKLSELNLMLDELLPGLLGSDCLGVIFESSASFSRGYIGDCDIFLLTPKF